MNPECEFEADVLAAALQSRFPEHVDADLRAHIAGCAICSDVAAIASAANEAREEMLPAVPDSGRVWWLAQVRARREAAEAAGRPITAAQLVAFACAVGLLGACFGATSAPFQAALASIHAKAAIVFAMGVLVQHGALILTMTAVFFLVSTAVYLVVGRD